MRAPARAAALAAASWLWLMPALAATFVLDDGSSIEGTIVAGTRNTVTIRPTRGGIRQLPVSRLERVEVATADGRTVLVGRYRGWEDGRSALEVGADLVWLEDDRVVARQPLITPVLAAARTAESAAPWRAAADVPAASSSATANASAGSRTTAALPPRMAATITAPLPPRSESPKPAAGPEPAAGPALAALPAGDLPVVSIRTSPDEIGKKSGTIAFTVELSRPLDDLLVVIYSTVDGGAQAGVDYQPLQGILTLPAGATSSEIRTSVLDDDEREGDEEFQLFLASNQISPRSPSSGPRSRSTTTTDTGAASLSAHARPSRRGKQLRRLRPSGLR